MLVMKKNDVELVRRLRNRESLKFIRNGIEIRFCLNKNDSRICWERWHKAVGATHKDRWVNQNLYLSIKDVLNIVHKIQDNTFNNLSIRIV